MLVYANHLTFVGADAQQGVFAAIAGWLKQKTGRKFQFVELKKPNKFDLEGSWVGVESADASAPELYSVVLKHGDDLVRGRQWIVEVGIESSAGQTAVSCVLKTDEISSLVSREIEVTRPMLVGYLVDNCELSHNTPGRKFVSLSGERDNYRGFLAEIERQERDHPILLVSPTKDDKYLINYELLQEQLVGLAQVVCLAPTFNSYEMEEILGRRWSAWDGAVNLFYSPHKDGRVHNRLFRSQEIESWGTSNISRVRNLLALITHNNNGTKLRSHIRPEGVRIMRLRKQLTSSAETGALTVTGLRDQLDSALLMAVEQEEQYKQDIQRIEMEKLYLEEDRDNFREELEKASWDIKNLQHQLNQADSNSSTAIETGKLLRFACRTDDPIPDECLELVAALFPENCEILETAYSSAREVKQFRQGRRLLDMLRRLVTDYRENMIKGGDSVARKTFTNNEYSANESETVVSNPEYRRKRTFPYKGEPVEMFRHLKVGVDDNTTVTIRVHFFWDGQTKKVVIGYCGKHLPIPSH